MLGNLTAVGLVVLIVCILISLAIHEFMHAYVGHLLGDTTAQQEGRLSLNPLNHIDPFMTVILPIITIILFKVPVLAAKPVPFNPERVKYDEFGAAMIAAAGPLTNLLLAFLAALLIRYVNLGSFLDGAIFYTFIPLNIALFVFNMIPIPPLDGSRVLYAFSPEPLQQLLRAIEPFGLFIVFALILGGGANSLLSNIMQFFLNLLP